MALLGPVPRVWWTMLALPDDIVSSVSEGVSQRAHRQACPLPANHGEAGAEGRSAGREIAWIPLSFLKDHWMRITRAWDRARGCVERAAALEPREFGPC